MKLFTKTLTLIFLSMTILPIQAQEKVLHHSELAKFLPITVKDYTAEGDVEGATIEASGSSYSTVSQDYEKDDLTLNLTLIDYSEAGEIYQATTMPWSLGMSIDTNEERANGVQVDGFTGWEVYHKIDKDASIVLGIYERYIFAAQCTDCDAQFLKEVIQSLNLKDLPQ